MYFNILTLHAGFLKEVILQRKPFFEKEILLALPKRGNVVL